MAIVMTFSIAVMLNERVDMSEEVLSEGMLNGCLILMNLLVPLAVVSYEVWQYQQGQSMQKDQGTPRPDGGMAVFENPVPFDDDDPQDN
jgi:hypothetical protein